jgi:hypothetical protein
LRRVGNSLEIDAALLLFRHLGLSNGGGRGSGKMHPSPLTILVWTLGKFFAKRVALAKKSPKGKEGRRHKQISASVGEA